MNMEKVGQQILEVEMQAELFKLALDSGMLNWEEEIIQFFIPLVLYHTNFDWLKLIAENNLVEEDAIVVKNFLEMVQSLMKINEEQLEQSVENKLKDMFGDM